MCYNRGMHFIQLCEPNILDSLDVMNFRQNVFDAKYEFKGSNHLDKFDNYLDWLAHTINNATSCEESVRHSTFIAKEGCEIVGIVEITYISNQSLSARVLGCISPSHSRMGYGKDIMKLAICECNSHGITRNNISFEISRKAKPFNPLEHD